MALQKTSKYIYSLFLLLLVLNVSAQKQEWYSVSIGGDLSQIAKPFIDTTSIGWEFSGDVELLKDMHGVVEIGSQTTHFDRELYSYNSAGGYTRIGVDYNFMKHLDVTSHDKMFIGVRYAFTTFYHEAQNITINNTVWGNSEFGNTGKNWLGANWFEVATGMRARLFNNFYLGWSARFKVKLWAGKDPQLATYSIPGFGRDTGNSSMGFNYSLYYKIPVWKKKAPKSEKDKKTDAPKPEHQ